MSTAGIMEARTVEVGDRVRKCPHTRNTRENCYASKIQLGTLVHMIEY